MEASLCKGVLAFLISRVQVGLSVRLTLINACVVENKWWVGHIYTLKGSCMRYLADIGLLDFAGFARTDVE